MTKVNRVKQNSYLHGQQKVGGVEHCYLRGLSLSKGVWGACLQEIFEAFEAKNSMILIILSNE